MFQPVLGRGSTEDNDTRHSTDPNHQLRATLGYIISIHQIFVSRLLGEVFSLSSPAAELFLGGKAFQVKKSFEPKSKRAMALSHDEFDLWVQAEEVEEMGLMRFVL